MQLRDDPRVGTELAGYRIESLLGIGGMSVVYLAEDLRLKRRVALKLLAAGLADDAAFRDRFLRESELAASIDHPNIVPIYEAGTTDDLLFIAMRYVEGRDLKARLQHGRLDPTDAIAIIAQVASALDAAHARALVHLDVKPSNVLLDVGARPDGSDHVYLADFGLTRQLSEEAGLGDDGRLVGTIDYVAPEQIAGEKVDGRADVYSLGCVLYECLAGDPPFRRDSDLAVVFAHLEAESPALSAGRPDLPAALDGIMARALAKDPDQRYATCREFARASLAVVVDEASRSLVDVASRAAAGRSDLNEVEAELAGRVVDLQLAHEQARALSDPTTPARAAAEGICPFKGLASFEPVDADYFFGRERLVAELVARLVGAGFLGIVGPSGSGKSSVLRAGLLPALAGGVLPGSEGWRRLLLRPGERPLEELRRVLVSGARDPIAEALETLPADGRLLLAVDQLEELFTTCSSDDERTAFAAALARAATDPDRRAVVVVALRADFYGRFAAYQALADLLGANQVLVGPMQPSELRRAVELPAGRVGLRVESELADTLVDDVEGQPGALPLLSTALLELWQKRDGNTLTLAAYRESGGVHGAVARLAEGTYARIPDEQKPLVRTLMLRLVGEGEGEAAVRRRAPLAELDLERNEPAGHVVATLADSRLVTVSEGSVEVAHEALLREWPRLREWIEEDDQGRRLRRHITSAARGWDDAGRDQGELYRGARLAAALDWNTEHALELNELEREFVTESREASEREARRARRTNRRLRALLIGIALLLAAAVAGGVLALAQRGEARDAETAQVAQRLGAQALVEEDLDLSLLLARQAVAIDDSPQTRGYLLKTLQRSPKAIGIMHATPSNDVLREIAISPDGKTLAVGGQLEFPLFDAHTYQSTRPPVKTSWAGTPAYSPDGKTLAYAVDDRIRLIDARTRKQLAEANVGPRIAQGLAFTRDGSVLVAVIIDVTTGVHSIGFRDALTLKPVAASIRPEGFTGAYIGSQWRAPVFVLTPDGRSLVTPSNRGKLLWWDLRTRRIRRTIEVPSGYHALALSPDGLTAAIGIERGIQLVDVRTGGARRAMGGPAQSPNYVLFSPDGKTVVSTNLDGSVILWDVASMTPRETLRGHSASVRQAVFSSDGKTLYTVSHDGSAIAWDVAGGRGLGRPFTFTHDRAFDQSYDGHPSRFSRDGRLIAVGIKQRGVALWDAVRLERVGPPLLETGGEVKALAFSPDGSALAAVTSNGKASVWDLGTRSLRWGPKVVDRDAVLGVSFSADGKMLATAAETGMRLWNSGTGAALGRIAKGTIGDVAFSPVAPVVAFVREGWDASTERVGQGGGTVEIWDVRGHSRIAKLEIEPGLILGYGLGFTSDGHLLASGGFGDPLIHLWDVESGKLVRELEQNVGDVMELAFSPDDKTLAIAGAEGLASLWDVASGAQIGPSLTAGSRRAMVDFSPDSRRLLVTTGDGQGAVWDVDPSSWATRACVLANRKLTREEWREFLPGRAYEPACTT